MTDRNEPKSSWHQRTRGVPVGAVERCLPGRNEAPERTLGHGRLRRPDFFTVASGLFEVVADDLVLLDQMGMRVEPGRELLVQHRPHLLRDRLVRGIANEQMPKSKCIVTRKRR